jgi:hypothetical protein
MTFGGKGSKLPDSYFDKRQLAIGTKVEMEHTTNRTIAKGIAKDHIFESSKEIIRGGKRIIVSPYYSELKKMEKKLGM